MTNQEALRMAYSKRKDSAGEERDFLNTIIQALEQTRWISVSERLPEKNCKTYLICTDDGYIASIMYDRSMGWLLPANVVAWMLLPPSYKPQESENNE